MNLLLWLLTSLGTTSTLHHIFASSAGAGGDEAFQESLELRPTPDGKLVSTFRFTTFAPALSRSPSGSGAGDGGGLELGLSEHYTLFPMPLGQILRLTDVKELRLELNSGNWDYERWGYEDGVGTGGEMWSWIEGDETRCVLSSARYTAILMHGQCE